MLLNEMINDLYEVGPIKSATTKRTRKSRSKTKAKSKPQFLDMTGERKRHEKTPIFMRRCVVKLMKEQGKDAKAAFAICRATMNKAGYYDSNKKLTDKGRARDEKYMKQKDTEAKLKEFDLLMKKERDSRGQEGALKRLFKGSKAESIINFDLTLSRIEESRR